MIEWRYDFENMPKGDPRKTRVGEPVLFLVNDRNGYRPTVAKWWWDMKSCGLCGTWRTMEMDSLTGCDYVLDQSHILAWSEINLPSLPSESE